MRAFRFAVVLSATLTLSAFADGGGTIGSGTRSEDGGGTIGSGTTAEDGGGGRSGELVGGGRNGELVGGGRNGELVGGGRNGELVGGGRVGELVGGGRAGETTTNSGYFGSGHAVQLYRVALSPDVVLLVLVDGESILFIEE
jgi:hypothetical protein